MTDRELDALVAERFAAKVSAHTETGCREWMGCRDKYGYGKFKVRSYVLERAHRFMWTMMNGPIPEGKQVLHRCDNPACVEIAHLFLGTHAENHDDKARKGRGPRKLSDKAVQDIRARCGAGASQGALAREYGVTQPAIFKVVHGEVYTHVR